ncbi:beta-lactamase class A [Caulobacter ginsengisoli]|uniref:Beta-lactamase n=1 Tax=Caulobacter ginsengisoli TaxID=400775 RepID=A0ABU0IKX8_9CAUL|nr:class A beta-lactamase [Caulobacter ginsengisoli]MDQ0462663.1 beta-lactamase class A [Caulobacter ginsengisoli]
MSRFLIAPRFLIAATTAGVLLLAGPAWPAPRPAPVPAAAPTLQLEREIARQAGTIDGVVGVAAWRLDGKGPRLLVRGDERFPMASTFKVAVAGAVLARVDRGELSLEQMLPVAPAQMIESEVLADRFIHPGVSLSVANLLELMLTQSDNSATDVLVAAAGGPAAVTAWVRGQGVEGLRVDRDTGDLLRGFFGIGPGPFPEALALARQRDPHLDDKGPHINPAFDDDPRDTATPAAMGQLLTRLFRGEALSPASTRLLIEMMGRCRTGDNRLRARMPADTTVADKTGTLGGSVNDVGVITLPDGRGQIVVAVFIKKSDLPFAARERVIADIARSVRDFYLLQAAP